MAKNNLRQYPSAAPRETKPAAKATERPAVLPDGWSEALVLASGVRDLLLDAACSPDGLTPEACSAIGLVAERLADDLAAVDAYLGK